jgi:hypothetical protein
MSEISRFAVNWSPEGTWVQHIDNGPCVYYEDYKKEIDQLTAELEHYRGIAMTEGAEKALADHQAIIAERDRYREALERLAKLGNGDRYGNSIGNEIAREALKEKEI